VTEVSYKNSQQKTLLEKSRLIGEHNLDNVALAVELAQQLKLPASSIERLLNFAGLAHRLETVGLFNNILYINDSKATAMDSVLVATQAALSKVNHESTLHLLLGGKDKNLPWEQLSILGTHKNIEFVFFGQCGELAQAKSNLTGKYYPKLEQAVRFVQSHAHAGDVVLLSPGGTSLDEFKNFEDRGNFFKDLVSKVR
jgi:UDP-N-acetylmuramoylalanine--D-glutamate ligase